MLSIPHSPAMGRTRPGMVSVLLAGAFLFASCASRPPAALALPQSLQPEEELTKAQKVLETAAGYSRDVLTQPDGKVRADYDLVTGVWMDYEPHWHTGQLILGLIEAWRITEDESLLASARLSGEWWVSTEFAPPHPLAGLVNAVHGDHVGDLINFTTIADGTPGLFELSRVTGDPVFADAATRSGRWLFDQMQVPDQEEDADGLFYNFVDPATGKVVTDYSPTHPGVTEPEVTQVARPNIEGFLFADMCRHTGEKVWCERFIRQARAALDRQDSDGLWMDFEPNDPVTRKVHPRFNVWNAEALLAAYEITGERAFLEGAARTGRYMARQQRSDGTIYYDLNADTPPSRQSITGSASAFSGILWLRLRDYGVDGFDEAISRSLSFALNNQFPENHPDPNLRGAILETRVRVVDGKTRIAIRDVSTTFTLRFLALWIRDRRGEDINAYLRGDTL